MLASSREKVKGQPLASFLTSDSLIEFNSLLERTFAGHTQAPGTIKLTVDSKETTVLIKVNLNSDGLECLTVMTDITTQKQAEIKLQLAASVFSHAHEGILITDKNGKILEVNNTFTKITGYSRQEAIGQNPRMLKSSRQSTEFYLAMWKTLERRGYWSSELWNKRKNGEVYPEMQSIIAVRDVDGNLMHYVSMFTDITERKAHQQELEHTAHHDMLTNLPNRAQLAKKLTVALKQSQRRGKILALAYLDLDGFKRINDTYGHCTGDQFLISISKHLEQSLRSGDFLARIGGDEFVAVLTDLDSASECEPILQRMLIAASQNIICGQEILKVSTSIGVTLFPQNGDDPDLLLRQADQAMYHAKGEGKSCYRFFDIDLDESTRTHRESIDHIRKAFEKNEFVLYYQPKVNMETGIVVGAEALIRWLHPQEGTLLPDKFLPMIESHSISIKIGEWVVQTVLQQITSWQEQGLVLPVSVNIGANQLQSANFVAGLAKALADAPQIPPNLLELEILETSAIEDMAQVSELMHACLQMGINFSLDDFGTGYSSLTYLKQLPVVQLKIDRSFVRDMLTDNSDLAIVKAVIGLADIFNRDVIAEGVETKAHGNKLLSLNCVIAQGYGIAEPMPADAFPFWVKRWQLDPIWTA
jgi:diguanylate cyclase (GGDEF)-like protein/PAS domain S-box-containing protein